jgi:hypothetical protein
VAGGDGRGCTWSNSNPWAVQLLWPDRRIDYIRGVNLLETNPVEGMYASDHFGVQADLRY